MKKTLLFIFILLAINTYGTQYLPLVTENAEWKVMETIYPYEFQMAKTVSYQIYTLHGDTVIGNLTYKKIGYKTETDGSTYKYLGAMREQDKRIYYIGNGYFSSFSSYNIGTAKIKAMNDCLSSFNKNGAEVLLYDFNAKPGDMVQWASGYRQVISEDSVLVGNSYRRCLHLSGDEKVVEGIGSVVNDMLSWVTPRTTCSDYFQSWEFDSFLSNGATLYRSTKNSQSLGYQTVYSHRKAYYNKTNINNTEILKMDSCVFFNDSVFYPSRALQLTGDECYDPKGGGWAGKKIVFNNNWNYFFNDDNDTIKIKTDAVLKEKWTLFQRSDILIAAAVTKWDTATVLGVTDSIKTITLHVFDSSMKPISHELENATIAISKHYGMTKALNFIYFPTLKFGPSYSVAKDLELVGITNPNLGIQNIKWFDVFDFQVGDEFHYVESNNDLMSGGSASERKYIIRILKREDFKDSIRYTEDVQSIRKFKQNIQSNYVTTSEHYQDTNLIQKNREFDQERGVPIFNNDSSRIEIYPMFNNSNIPEIFYKNNGCWTQSIIYSDACGLVSYAKGRGLVSSSYGWELQNHGNLEQVYYKKGAETWGNSIGSYQ
jgi:hypothetical protein